MEDDHIQDELTMEEAASNLVSFSAAGIRNRSRTGPGQRPRISHTITSGALHADTGLTDADGPRLGPGTSFLALLLAGYFAQIYLPPPKPKIVGIDLGTTYSCIGIYHAVTGLAEVLTVQNGKQCIPSVVAYTDKAVVVGYDAVAQADHNPTNTLYDAKRFIGKRFTQEQLDKVQAQYSFHLTLDRRGMAKYVVKRGDSTIFVRPEDVGATIIETLKSAAEEQLNVAVKRVVLSVPAEFDWIQRNYTSRAASIAGVEVMRVINEPTAAALAYGLHKHPSLQNVMVIDLGGGTLDVSILSVRGGMFLTQAMAGNNYLGGQDFNQRILHHFHDKLTRQFHKSITDAEDLQTLRAITEDMKLNLTVNQTTHVNVKLKSIEPELKLSLTRDEFDHINADLFKKVLEPIRVVLESVEMSRNDIDEIVLVGGSTRIPKVRSIIHKFFDKIPNTSIDPEIAVGLGVSVQAGIIGGMWPLTVSAVELPMYAKKIHVL